MKGENRPLAGKRVVVTRAAEQAAGLYTLLEEAGAEPVLLPTIQFIPLPAEGLQAAVEQLTANDWLLFTSANAVAFFFHYVKSIKGDKRPCVAAVGRATADKLVDYDVQPDFVPEEFVGEALAAGLGDLTGRRVLLPRSRKGRPQLVEQLRAQGATVEEIAIYDTVTAAPTPQALAIIRQGVDALTFTSPSSVRGFLALMDGAGIERSLLAQTVIACIGPVTVEAVEAAGFVPTVTAEEYTAAGLVQALIGYYGQQSYVTYRTGLKPPC